MPSGRGGVALPGLFDRISSWFGTTVFDADQRARAARRGVCQPVPIVGGGRTNHRKSGDHHRKRVRVFDPTVVTTVSTTVEMRCGRIAGGRVRRPFRGLLPTGGQRTSTAPVLQRRNPDIDEMILTAPQPSSDNRADSASTTDRGIAIPPSVKAPRPSCWESRRAGGTT
jgi:hypothetical protein